MTKCRATLVSYTPDIETMCAAAMRSCASVYPSDYLLRHFKGEPLEGEKSAEKGISYFIEKAFDDNSLDVLETGSFTYSISKISKTSLDQLIRHRLTKFSGEEINPSAEVKSHRYVKLTREKEDLCKIPPSLKDAKVKVDIKGVPTTLTFEEWTNLSVDVEKALLENGAKAEDARYAGIAARTTNLTATMNPRELLHVLLQRTDPTAQWETRDISWSMFADAKLIAPNIFGSRNMLKLLRGSNEEKRKQYEQQLLKLDSVVDPVRSEYEKAQRGEFVEIPMEEFGCQIHPVEAWVRKVV